MYLMNVWTLPLQQYARKQKRLLSTEHVRHRTSLPGTETDMANNEIDSKLFIFQLEIVTNRIATAKWA